MTNHEGHPVRLSQEELISDISPYSDVSSKLGRKPHVVVVGAGVAGLRCAEVLLEQGISVTIIEGRNRIGGRSKVHQIDQKGHKLDMGANWIHGTVENPILDLAKETGTVLSNVGEEVDLYSEYGLRIANKTRARELQDLVWGIISDAFKYSNEHGATIDPWKSLCDFMHEELAKRDLQPDDLRTATYIAEQWGDFTGDHYSLQSLKYFWMEENLPGENLFVASTYQAIVERIAAKARAEATLLLGHQVTTIGQILHSSPLELKVYATDLIKRESVIAQCDAAVVTVPLGILKRGLPAIHPKPLPPAIQAGIDGLGFGQLEKVYITFMEAWWHEASDGPSFYQFLHPLHDGDNATSTHVTCMDLSLLPEKTAQPTLLFYVHGPFAYDLVQDLERFEKYEQEGEHFLARRFRAYYSQLPNFSYNNHVCTPIGVSMTRWRVDPWTLGSYTNFPISGMDETPHVDLVKGVEALRRGMPERGVYFAGEHTAPFVAIGTVTGAYWSGEHVAKRIIDSYMEKGS